MSRPDHVMFFVAGTPRPAGSKFAQVVRTKDPASGRMVPKILPETGQPQVIQRDASGTAGAAWRRAVRTEGQAAMSAAGLRPFEGPVRVTVIFRMRRPKAHFIQAGLRPGAPEWHVSRPDVDKLSRAVLDALKGVCWVDDSQVAYKEAMKPYCAPGQDEGAEIAVQILNRTETGQMELVSDGGD